MVTGVLTGAGRAVPEFKQESERDLTDALIDAAYAWLSTESLADECLSDYLQRTETP